MTKCAMTGKKVKCPFCGHTQVCFDYHKDRTIIQCMNYSHKNFCYRRWITHHWRHEEYPKFLEELTITRNDQNG